MIFGSARRSARSHRLAGIRDVVRQGGIRIAAGGFQIVRREREKGSVRASFPIRHHQRRIGQSQHGIALHGGNTIAQGQDQGAQLPGGLGGKVVLGAVVEPR